jgi:predicted glycogen debranching enzyme
MLAAGLLAAGLSCAGNLSVGKAVLRDFDKARQLEYVLGNGLGGFSFSTVAGANTYRYHGLLIAGGAGERRHLLSDYQETVAVDGKEYRLDRTKHAAEFQLYPVPTWTYALAGVRLEKRVFMVHGENTVVVMYRLLEAPKGARVRLGLRPLLTGRSYHALSKVRAEVPSLHFASPDAAFEPDPRWVKGGDYLKEGELLGGLVREDYYSPGRYTLALELGGAKALLASAEPHALIDAEKLLAEETARMEGLLAASKASSETSCRLVLAGDKFLIKRQDGLDSVIAGYPWFTDWGRDTMISLPGLVLVTGRFEEARRILETFAKYADGGMIPNLFPDGTAKPAYNTVDASLWMFWAVHKYALYTGDYGFIKEKLYPVLAEIIARHRSGTRYNIHMDEDGLISAGEEGVQLTWMDAKAGDWVVTPRMGKPVEIQALWYNALRVMEDLAQRFGREEEARGYRALAEKAQASFLAKFWNAEAGCLYDVVDDLKTGKADASVRPNQVLALSLTYPILTGERAASVLEVVERELLTPYGLRSLSPKDQAYKGRYNGDMRTRDAAYHQGTVWGWLIGPYMDAYFSVHGETPKTRENAARALGPLRAHLLQSALGTVSEIFEGDAPHAPRGCPAQAWSVAELLRVSREHDLPK